MTFRRTDQSDAIDRELDVLAGRDEPDDDLRAARERFAARARSFDELTRYSCWSPPEPVREPQRTGVLLAIAALLCMAALVGSQPNTPVNAAPVNAAPVNAAPGLRAMGGASSDLAVRLIPDDGGLRLNAVLPDGTTPGWLTVATLQDDGSGFILASGTSHPAGPGSVSLNGRIRLDDYPGHEWLVVAHSDQPLSDHAVHALLDASLDALSEAHPIEAPAGMAIWTTTLRESP